MPIITNEDRDKTVQQVILQVNQELARHFEGSPREVFGVIIEQMSAAASGDSWFDVAGALAE
jgi:hypothetical protein